MKIETPDLHQIKVNLSKPATLQETQKPPSKETVKSDINFFGGMGVYSVVVLIICISAFSNGNVDGGLILGFILSMLIFIISGGIYADLLKGRN